MRLEHFGSKEWAWEIGQRIAAARELRGLTQTSLACRVERSSQCVSRWESGERVPTAATLVRIAAVLEVKVDYLLGTPAPARETELLQHWDAMTIKQQAAVLAYVRNLL